MVKVSKGTDPLLRRPLSIHRVDVSSGTIALLYEVVGRSTELLSMKKASSGVNVIGPLGNSFSFSSTVKCNSNILVAGGMGIAPLFFLAQHLRPATTTVLIGARTAADILCAADFKKLGCEVRTVTEDGSLGFRGLVTDLLDGILVERTGSHKIALYGCGPKPMLEAMADLCSKHGLAAELSLESHMACGIGACRGCVVPTVRGYMRVCKEGPVFKTGDLAW